MDDSLFVAFQLVFSICFLVRAAWIPFSADARLWGKQPVVVVGTMLVLLGGIGFFGAGLSATGGMNWLPQSFEWPVGYADVVTLPSGFHVVQHSPSGRIQVYDRDWHFIRGWHVAALGGVFKVFPAADDRMEVVTQRGQHRFLYSLSGDLVWTGSYAPASYYSIPDASELRMVPTFWLLLPFSNPFSSGAVMAIGMGILELVRRLSLTKDHQL